MKTKNEKNSKFYFILKRKSNVPFDPRIMLEEIDFDIHKAIFWTDSKITLSYIRSLSKKLSVYIMNRLHEIKLNSNVNEWCFQEKITLLINVPVTTLSVV